jgi:predicted P-loop ATPase
MTRRRSETIMADPLTPEDVAMLEGSYITAEIAAAAGIYRVPSVEGRALVGRKDKANYAGVVFLYRWPGDDYVYLHRLRLDHPPFEDGKPAYRYLTAAESRNRLFLPPCDPDLPGILTRPLIVTEGEKKCLALWRMATETSNGTGEPAFLPVGLPGVYGWRGTIGTKNNSHGERVQEKGPIPDLDRIGWLNRKVTILFDANTATNPKVRYARRDLARELSRRGAVVYLADLPEAVGVNGCDDYLHMFGVEKLAEVLNHAVRYEWRQDLILTDKGKIKPLLANAITALRSAPEWTGVLTFDEFSLRASAGKATPWNYAGTWDEQCDRLLADWLQHHGIMVSVSTAAEAAEAVAHDRTFHPVRDYLDSLQWDKIGRIDDWLTLYLGVDQSDFVRAAGAKWLISAVARIYQPGCKADHMLIAEGPQGALKSTAFRILGEPWFSDDIPDLGSKDSKEFLLGVWIIELPELDAMTRAELTRVKAFMTCSTDRFRPPYGRRTIAVPRQCVLAGTVNHEEYLRDETGGRRFWPVKVGQINIDALRRDRDQIWAEAVHCYRKGDSWWLQTALLNEAAEQQQEVRYQSDAWESVITKWLEANNPSEVTVADILGGPLDKHRSKWERGDQTRIGVILRQLKWVVKPGHERPRVYVKGSQPSQPNQPKTQFLHL